MTDSVVYLLPDAIGGVPSIIANLLRYRRPDGLQYHVVVTRDLTRTADTPISAPLGADSQRCLVFERYLDNFGKVLRRVYDAIPAGSGVAVANDWLDLAVLAKYDCNRAVLQILHGDIDYYYRLAARYDSIVDGFIAPSRLMYEKLQDLLPHRCETIFHLPYGVPVPSQSRTPASGPIRLLFAARFEERKGICDLPAIDAALLSRGVEARWTVVGSGPVGDRVKAQWSDARVSWTGGLPHRDLLQLFLAHDVFVLPTRWEGFPVALLEAMAAGVVPVVSDLPGALREAVSSGATGFAHPFSDIDGFAASIAELDRNREKLESMSAAARRTVQEEFNIEQRAQAYQGLFLRWRELRRPRALHPPATDASRLDQEWIPNGVVRALRKVHRWTKARKTRSGQSSAPASNDDHPIPPVTIVVLGKYPQVFRGFLETSERFAAGFPKVLVRDGSAICEPAGWAVIQGPEEFSMAGNGNLGMKAVPRGSDVLYCGDDVRFTEAQTVERLGAVAHQHPEVGILSPRLRGRGSRPQLDPASDLEYVRPPDMWFPCVYIKRELLDRIGFLDERFSGYGSDDLDFCLRAELAGYKLAVTRLVTVCHEDARGGGPTTFLRAMGRNTFEQQQASAIGKLCAKWGVDWETMFACFKSGDYSRLLPEQTDTVLAAAARGGLRKLG